MILDPSVLLACIIPGRISSPIAFLAWVLSIVACSSCAYMYITASSNYSVDNYYFGLFELNGYGSECFEYSDAGYDEDGALKAGQAFAVLTALIGSFLLISIVLGFFLKFPIWLWRVILISEFVIAGFAILSLSAMGYEQCSSNGPVFEEYCLPGEGAICSVWSCIYWIVSGSLVCQMPMPEKPLIDCCGGNGSCYNQTNIPTATATPRRGAALPPIGALPTAPGVAVGAQ